MARLEDLDEWIDGYLQSMKKAYYETDPAKGENDETSKHKYAQLVIERFWYLHGKLLSWAQAHMTGYSVLAENVELHVFLERETGVEITRDSHILEQIGLLYNYNPPNSDDEDLNATQLLLAKFNAENPGDEELIFTPSAQRLLIRELLMSRCADNSYWRFELQNSLAALNEGEIDDLSRPAPGRHQGLPFSLNRWKLEALQQVRYRVGKGLKKYRALEEIGQAIGQSSEALRAWEKDLEKSLDRWVELYCSELAGQYDAFFRGVEHAQIPYHDDYEYHRGINHVDHARHLHAIIIKRDLDEIQAMIRFYRGAKSLAQKGG